MKKRLSALFAALTLFGSVGLSVRAVVAQEGQSSGLQISPPRTELTIEAGSSELFGVDLKNVTSGNVTVNAQIDDFIPAENGTPQIIPYSEERRAESIKPFIRGIEDFSLEMTPGQSQRVEFTAEIPSDQSAGAYYGVIRFQALPGDPGTGSGQVSLTASVGHIVLIQVPGNITESMQLSALQAVKNGEPGTLFNSAPDKARVVVKNTGNSFLKPFGTVSISKNGKEVYSFQVNNTDPQANVLPNSTRVFENNIENVGSIGKYEITATIAYTQGGEVLTMTSSFWVIPVWVAIAAGVLLIALVLLVVFVVRKLRKK